MPITVNTVFSAVPQKISTAGFSTVPLFNNVSQIVANQQEDFIVSSSISFDDTDTKTETAGLSTVSATEVATTPLNVGEFFNSTVLGFTTLSTTIGPLYHPMRLTVGSGTTVLTEDIFTVFGNLNVIPKYCLYELNGNTIEAGFHTAASKLNETANFALSVSGITSSGNLELVDLLGPQLFNLIPASGGSFIDPSTDISFDLIDTGGATIVPGTINIYVNGIQVIGAGVDVTPVSFGNTTFAQISDSFYQFEFTSASGFDLAEYVNVSGIASDNLTPSANTTIFSYDFLIWGESDITASISGSPDAAAPFLDNLNPLPFQTEVAVDSNIYLDIADLHTGVDQSTVRIYLEGELLISGSSNVNPTVATVVTSGYDFGRSYSYIIDPSENFNFSDTIDLEIRADDLYSPANSLSGTYSFYTQQNNHLVASGLSVDQDAIFTSMSIGSSYITTSSTPFRVDYINTLDIPIDISGSNIQVDGVIIPSVFTSVTGSDSHYQVEFNLTPDYDSDSDLIFHVQQSGTVSGNIVAADYYTTLLWGYEVCYDSEELLDREQSFQSVVNVCDSADNASLSTNITEFDTEPFLKNTLGASIVPINPPGSNLYASIVPNSTFFEYGKDMTLELEAEDFAGNKLVFSWSFTIEDK